MEFERQVDNLVRLGYPALAQIGEHAFRETLAPLATIAEKTTTKPRADGAYHVPFVLVVTRGLVATEETVPLLTLPGKKKGGVVDKNYQGELVRFQPLPELGITHSAYLIVDVERGEEFRDVKPVDATATIIQRGRTPLTIEEGVALATHFPDALEKNKCFMLAGSRSGDRRVPALWISDNAPKLGWCWNGNPHSWLGTASCGSRMTAP